MLLAVCEKGCPAAMGRRWERRYYWVRMFRMTSSSRVDWQTDSETSMGNSLSRGGVVPSGEAVRGGK